MTITSQRPSQIQLPVKESLFRGGRANVGETTVTVDRDGGKNEAGMLCGVSLISVGEALGHSMWIDDVTLSQVNEFAAQMEKGLKSRFTHPSMSSDGMGRHLGRIHDFHVDGSRVLGDLHFAKSAHNAPDGDLADYVMELADEDSAAAGLSIVFDHDFDAEKEFLLANGGEIVEVDDGWGVYEAIVGFESPDPANVNNYPHVRLAKLRAADVVDEPAANPDGLFDRQTLPRELDGLLKYATGLSRDKPTDSPFGVDADRAQQFMTRWLSANGLSITPEKESSEMSDSPKPVETPTEPSVTRESLLAEQKRYTDKFGADDGVKWFAEGKTFEEALSLFSDKQSQRIAALETELSDAKEKVSSLEIGEIDPVDATVTQDGQAKERLSLGSLMKPKAN